MGKLVAEGRKRKQKKIYLLSRSVVGVGVDTPSTDFGQSRSFETHQILAAENIWGLENVANLDQVPPRGR